MNLAIANRCDLHHALSASSCSPPALTPVSWSSLISALFENGTDFKSDDKKFPLYFSRHVQRITSFLQEIDSSSNCVREWFHSLFSCLPDFKMPH